MKIKGFYWSKGNSKVLFPIVNTGAGTDCPSAKWCAFSGQNCKAAGRKQCYAQKTERLRPSVLASRRRNADLIESWGVEPSDVADRIARYFDKNGAEHGRIVRINEAGDLSLSNIQWVCELIKELRANGIKPYMYSKASETVRNFARQAGAVVLQSERDFVAMGKTDYARHRGPKCPGVCGPCKRCPSGLRTAILEH